MELDKAILQIYPDIDFLDGVRLQDDGAGPYIARWNDPRPQPSEAELQAAWAVYEAGALDRQKADLISQLSAAYKTRFEATAPDWRELKYWMKDANRQRYEAGATVPGIELEAAAFKSVADSPDNDFTGKETFIDPATGKPKEFDLTTAAGLAEVQGAKFAVWVDMEFARLEADYQAAQTTIKYAVSIDTAMAAYNNFVEVWD